MLFLDAGPLQEAPVCSQIEQAARLAATETPDPLLVPLGTRSVSYGLHAWPPQRPYARVPPGRTDVAFRGSGLGGPPMPFPVAAA